MNFGKNITKKKICIELLLLNTYFFSDNMIAIYRMKMIKLNILLFRIIQLKTNF